MKHLLLFRHGKSDWKADFDHDHERPLAGRGVKAAKAMGKLLKVVGYAPDHVITSSAVRARTTYELAAKAGDWTAPFEVQRRLYHASPDTLLNIAQAAPDEADILALFGHEPTFSLAVRMSVGGGRHRVPTAAVAGIAWEVDSWDEIAFGSGELRFLLPARMFS